MTDTFSEEYKSHIEAAHKYTAAWAKIVKLNPLNTGDTSAKSLNAYSLACEEYVEAMFEYGDSFKNIGSTEPSSLKDSARQVLEQKKDLFKENETVINESNNDIEILKNELLKLPDLTNNIITIEEWIFGCYPDLKTLIESDWDSCGYEMMEVYDNNGDYLTMSQGRNDWFENLFGFEDVNIDLAYPIKEQPIDFEAVAKKLEYDDYGSDKEEILSAIAKEEWEELLSVSGAKYGEAKLSASNDAFASTREYYFASFKYTMDLQNSFIKLYEEGLITDSEIIELASKKFVWIIFEPYEHFTYYKFDNMRDGELITFSTYSDCNRFNIQEALKAIPK